MHLLPLPPLPFGKSHIEQFASETEIFDYLSGIGRPLRDVRKLAAGSRISLSTILMPQLTLIGAAFDPMQFDAVPANQMGMIIPVIGAGYTRRNSKTELWHAHRDIILNPYIERASHVYTASTSVIVVSPATERVVEALRAMYPDKSDALSGAGLMNKLVRPLGPRMHNFRSLFTALCGLIDSCNNDIDHLQRIGVDEVIFRLYGEYLIGEALWTEEQVRDRHPPRSAKALDIVCEHISQNIGQPLTLTQMERMTGLSGRALNYAFRGRFGCSPQQWQRNFHLDRAREALQRPDKPRSVKQISYDFGFASPQSFSGFYLKRFGEKPSDTMSMKRPKR